MWKRVTFCDVEYHILLPPLNPHLVINDEDHLIPGELRAMERFRDHVFETNGAVWKTKPACKLPTGVQPSSGGENFGFVLDRSARLTSNMLKTRATKMMSGSQIVILGKWEEDLKNLNLLSDHPGNILLSRKFMDWEASGMFESQSMTTITRFVSRQDVQKAEWRYKEGKKVGLVLTLKPGSRPARRENWDQINRARAQVATQLVPVKLIPPEESYSSFVCSLTGIPENDSLNKQEVVDASDKNSSDASAVW